MEQPVYYVRYSVAQLLNYPAHFVMDIHMANPPMAVWTATQSLMELALFQHLGMKV
jgi:hypothetical protein